MRKLTREAFDLVKGSNPVVEVTPHHYAEHAPSRESVLEVRDRLVAKLGRGQMVPGRMAEVPTRVNGRTFIVQAHVKDNPGEAHSWHSKDDKGGHVQIHLPPSKSVHHSVEALNGTIAHELTHCADPASVGASTSKLNEMDHNTHPAEHAAIRAHAVFHLDDPDVVKLGKHRMQHGAPWNNRKYTHEEAATEMLAQVPRLRAVHNAGLHDEMHRYAMGKLTE